MTVPLPKPTEYVWQPDGTFDIGQERHLSTNTGPCTGWTVYPIYTSTQLQAYGEACRKEALEEAANVCEHNASEWVNLEARLECAEAIRGLK